MDMVFLAKMLNKEESDISLIKKQIEVLEHILNELIEHGCIIRTSTIELASICKCKDTTVKNVLSVSGFKYDRDRRTHIEEDTTSGLFERYWQEERDNCNRLKRNSSIFDIIATEKLYTTLNEELGMEIEFDKELLSQLHEDSLNKKHTSKINRKNLGIIKHEEIVEEEEEFFDIEEMNVEDDDDIMDYDPFEVDEEPTENINDIMNEIFTESEPEPIEEEVKTPKKRNRVTKSFSTPVIDDRPLIDSEGRRKRRKASNIGFNGGGRHRQSPEYKAAVERYWPRTEFPEEYLKRKAEREKKNEELGKNA